MGKCLNCNLELLYYNDMGQYCPQCYSVFTTVLPSDEELTRFYNIFNEYYNGGGRFSCASERQRKYASRFLKLLIKFSSGKDLLDIGSSTNPFPNLVYLRVIT